MRCEPTRFSIAAVHIKATDTAASKIAVNGAGEALNARNWQEPEQRFIANGEFFPENQPYSLRESLIAGHAVGLKESGMAYWLMRSEPDVYGWDDLVKDGGTEWDGVRNYTARNFLKDMLPGDLAIFYHSNTEKAAVGVMEITRAWKPDGPPNAKGEPIWASVRVEPRDKLARPVTLAEIKDEPRLEKLEMLRQSRLSVTPVRDEEWAVIRDLSTRS
jgi:predicted RNA-binding protein with PUA-like domain